MRKAERGVLPYTPLLGTSLLLKPFELYAVRTSLQFLDFCSLGLAEAQITADTHTASATIAFIVASKLSAHTSGDKTRLSLRLKCISEPVFGFPHGDAASRGVHFKSKFKKKKKKVAHGDGGSFHRPFLV